MKKFLMSTAALCLLLAAPAAMAQPNRHDHGGNHDQGHAQQHENHNTKPATRPATRPAPTARPAAQPAARPTPATRPATRPAASQHHNNNRPGTNRPGNHTNPAVTRPGHNNRPGFDRPNNRAHARPDYSRYHRARTAPKRFRIGHYHAPRGYHYQRWSYGQHLPAIYYSNTYWLSNFLLYGLFAPPPDAVWVRYGPDALLVDRYSGEIISVEYNVFY
jgi:Ni/Co efflux regulator RcnB